MGKSNFSDSCADFAKSSTIFTPSDNAAAVALSFPVLDTGLHPARALDVCPINRKACTHLLFSVKGLVNTSAVCSAVGETDHSGTAASTNQSLLSEHGLYD